MPARIPALVLAMTLLAPVGAALAQPKVEVMPASVDFGVSPVGTKVARQLMVANSGKTTLSINQVMLQDLTGTFAMGPLQQPPLNLPAGGKFTVGMTFLPNAEGSYSATLMLVTNDPMAKNVRVPLNGSGAK